MGIGGVALKCAFPIGVSHGTLVRGYHVCTATCGPFVCMGSGRLGNASPRAGNSSTFPAFERFMFKIGLAFWLLCEECLR